MKREDFNCPECGGTGQVLCPRCEATMSVCAVCDGTGLNPTKINVASFRKDSEAFRKQYGRSWNWIVDGKWLGREAPNGATLPIEPYLLSTE